MKQTMRIVEIEKTGQKCDKHGFFEAKVLRIAGSEQFGAICPKCEAIKREIEAKKQQEIEAELKRIKIEQNKKKLSVPLRYQSKTFENFETKLKQQEIALKTCKSFVSGFSEIVKNGASMVLCGTAGTGKTHLACAILYEIANQGFSGLYVRAFEMSREIKATFGRKSEDETAVYRKFISPDLFVIDEVGAQYGSETEKLILFEVVGKRYDAMKPTILVSNLIEKELEDFVGIRVLDRMRENRGKVITFNHASNRK